MRIAILDIVTGRIWSSDGKVHPQLLSDVARELGIVGPIFSERLPSGRLLIWNRFYEGYVHSFNLNHFYHRKEAEALVGCDPHTSD
jgi:hypothetical protein